MIWADIPKEKREGVVGKIRKTCMGFELVEERERLAWLSQLRHPYRLNPEGGRVLG
jgi:hypothetical protein